MAVVVTYRCTSPDIFVSPSCGGKGPMVLWATDEPHFFLRFCADRLLCARPIAQRSFGGYPPMQAPAEAPSGVR